MLETDPALPYATLVLSDGSRVEIPKPSSRDRSAILAKLRADRRAALIANMNEAKLTPEQRFAELEGFADEGPYRDDKLIDFLNTTEGADEVFLLVVRKKFPEPGMAEEILDNIGGSPLSVLVPLFGLTWRKKDEHEKSSGGSLNPPRPAIPTVDPPADRQIEMTTARSAT